MVGDATRGLAACVDCRSLFFVHLEQSSSLELSDFRAGHPRVHVHKRVPTDLAEQLQPVEGSGGNLFARLLQLLFREGDLFARVSVWGLAFSGAGL